MRGFSARHPYLQEAIDNIKPHVIAIQETHCTARYQPKLAGFNPPIMKNRLNRKGGGVAIFVHNSIALSPLNLDLEIEITAVKIHHSSKTIHIYNAL